MMMSLPTIFKAVSGKLSLSGYIYNTGIDIQLRCQNKPLSQLSSCRYYCALSMTVPLSYIYKAVSGKVSWLATSTALIWMNSYAAKATL